eukprot:7080296-Alexandrium_andersonii.AAC.1
MRSRDPIARGCGIPEAWAKEVAEMKGAYAFTVQTYMGRVGASIIKQITLDGDKYWLKRLVLRRRSMPRCDVFVHQGAPRFKALIVGSFRGPCARPLQSAA